MLNRIIVILQTARAVFRGYKRKQSATRSVCMKTINFVSAIYTASMVFKTVKAEEQQNHTSVQLPTFDELILKVNKDGETYLIELMQILSKCVVETSDEYRSLLQRCITFLEQGQPLTPEQQKELECARIQAIQLKALIAKYKEVINSIGFMAYHQAILLYLTGSQDAKDLVCFHYANLEQLAAAQFEENSVLESKINSEILSSK